MANPNDLIFALDTGTRTVTGLVMDDHGPQPVVLASVTLEHRSRSMLDGQIHDIEAVASVVRQVKEELEQRLGLTLTEAAVAAAGRALLTRRARITAETAQLGEIEAEDVRRWELEAVQLAQAQLREESAASGATRREAAAPSAAAEEVYHCVGYAVVAYELDGSRIKNLVGHRGRQIAVEVLATFLPEVVVDSLYTVLRRAGLTVSSMTLEPIAASHVAIPVDLRQLNLSLVDIGAGTSDIAVARHGSIIAFGMVPFAGDEVSERLCENYLLDFATAEQVKRELAAGGEVTFTDVLGNRHTCPKSQLLAEIEPVVEELAERIAERIVALNEKPPSAVLCVGGGSLTPLLPAKLAQRLTLAPSRVVVRGREELPVELAGDLEGLSGPEAVTPIGIALSARSQKGLAFRSWEVTVNDRRVRLFNLVAPRVADALLAAGVPAGSLRGRLGLALTVKVNGEFRVVPGTPGQPGRLLLGGKEAGLDTPIDDGDRITVIPAVDGRDAAATLADLVPRVPDIPVSLNKRRIVLRPHLTIDGRAARYTDPVPDGAEVEFAPRNRLRDLLELMDVDLDGGEGASFTYYYNGSRRTYPSRRQAVLVNGQEAPLDRELRPGDSVEVLRREDTRPTVAELLEAEGEQAWRPGRDLHVSVNGTPVTIPGRRGGVLVNGREAKPDDPVPEGADLRVEQGGDAQAYFAEVFNYYPVDLSAASAGQRLVLRLNGAEAEYTSPLSEGDTIEVRWEPAPPALQSRVR
ncbi:MAG: cell division FtsA domain-containing protein [Bacillota bacterium]|nr:cell division FtsA domain-containing protein [Bacillota bacterium]